MTLLTSQNRVLPAHRLSPRLVMGAAHPHAWGACGAALSSESNDLQRDGRRTLPGRSVIISTDSRFNWPAPADSIRGRLHADCHAIHMKIPFLAVSAPTSKIVNLLSEGAAELDAIGRFLTSAEQGAEDMFNNIAVQLDGAR